MFNGLFVRWIIQNWKEISSTLLSGRREACMNTVGWLNIRPPNWIGIGYDDENELSHKQLRLHISMSTLFDLIHPSIHTPWDLPSPTRSSIAHLYHPLTHVLKGTS